MKKAIFHGTSFIKNLVGIKAPFILGQTITWRCNYRCPFCFGKVFPKIGGELNTKEVKDLIDQAWNLGCVTYSVSGGEPLLRNDLPELLKYAKSIGFITNFFTNGFFIEKRLHEFKNYVDYVFISLDFPDERHSKERGNPQAFERVMNAVKLLKNEEIKTHFSCIMTKQNLDSMPRILDLAEEMGIGMAVIPVTEFESCKGSFGATNKQYQKMLSKLIELKSEGKPIMNSYSYLKLVKDRKRFICRNNMQLSVDPYGYVMVPCFSTAEIGIEASRVGNVRENSLKEIWFSERAERNRKIGEKCNSCYAPCYLEPSEAFSLKNILSTFQVVLKLIFYTK